MGGGYILGIRLNYPRKQKFNVNFDKICKNSGKLRRCLTNF